MRQHISIEQAKQLGEQYVSECTGDALTNDLAFWVKGSEYFTIGKLIELLNIGEFPHKLCYIEYSWDKVWCVSIWAEYTADQDEEFKQQELIDALFDALMWIRGGE